MDRGVILMIMVESYESLFIAHLIYNVVELQTDFKKTDFKKLHKHKHLSLYLNCSNETPTFVTAVTCWAAISKIQDPVF